jgi:hypothetical protein
MVRKVFAVLSCLLLISGITAAAGNGVSQIHVTHKDGSITSGTENVRNGSTPSKSLTSANAITPTNASMSLNASTPTQETHSIDSKSMGSSMVSDGIGQFGKSIIDGMYSSFTNNSAVSQKFGSTRGALFTVLTFVPNPYTDPTIKGLFTNYNDLAILFVIVFIFGEWSARNLARTKVTSSVFDEKDLSTSKFFGGLCMCGIALSANLFYMFALQIIQALSQSAMGNVMGSIAPTPDNLILYAMMALCDLTVFIFFVIRYFVIYAVAILCTIIAVLLIPDFSRGFAKKSIENILRILLLQPVAIFFTALGILTMKGLPAGFQSLGYIGLTVLVFIVCWYMLCGNFEFIKKGAKIAISGGVV